MGVQGIADHIFGQLCDLGAIDLGGIPTHKGMPFISGNFQGNHLFIGIKTLNRVRSATAVLIVIHITKVRRTGSGILCIQINIGFTQAASYQTGQCLSAGIAVKRKCPDQFAAGGTTNDGVKENAVGIIDPGSPQIVCKAHQGIKLILAQFQLILFDELFIQHGLDAGQVVAKQNFCGFFRDAVGFVLLQHIIGAFRTVTNGILTVVIIGVLAEALFLLQVINTCITHGINIFCCIGFCLGSRCDHLDDSKD